MELQELGGFGAGFGALLYVDPRAQSTGSSLGSGLTHLPAFTSLLEGTNQLQPHTHTHTQSWPQMTLGLVWLRAARKEG